MMIEYEEEEEISLDSLPADLRALQATALAGQYWHKDRAFKTALARGKEKGFPNMRGYVDSANTYRIKIREKRAKMKQGGAAERSSSQYMVAGILSRLKPALYIVVALGFFIAAIQQRVFFPDNGVHVFTAKPGQTYKATGRSTALPATPHAQSSADFATQIAMVPQQPNQQATAAPPIDTSADVVGVEDPNMISPSHPTLASPAATVAGIPQDMLSLGVGFVAVIVCLYMLLSFIRKRSHSGKSRSRGKVSATVEDSDSDKLWEVP